MKITQEQVLKVAHLARLALSQADIERFAEQIGTILDYVEKLNQVDTQGVIPTAHAVPMSNAFREDEPRDHLERRQAVANAPEAEEGAFIVPKVIE